MKQRSVIVNFLVVVSLMALIGSFPVQASGDQQMDVLYQTSFATDPRWVTNNPSMDYWDPALEMYHFSIEPSTGAYAYVPIDDYKGGAFTLEYDLILNQVDPDATFRLGFSGAAMNPEKGPNVLTKFTNAKYGRIMWLHLVTPSNKLSAVNSESGDSQTSGPAAYDGPTVKYELNKTYRVTVNYNTADNIVTMKVNEKQSGSEIWGYYLKAGDDLHGMDRIYIGSIGDYQKMNIYATGYLDNVRLTVPTKEVSTPAVAATAPVVTAASAIPTKKITQKQTQEVPTSAVPANTPTPESPLAGTTVIAALGITGLFCGLFLKRNQ